MKRLDFMKALAALPFVGRAVARGDQPIPGKGPAACPRCGGLGEIRHVDPMDVLVLNVPNHYMVAQSGPLYRFDPCPDCNPHGPTGLAALVTFTEPK